MKKSLFFVAALSMLFCSCGEEQQASDASNVKPANIVEKVVEMPSFRYRVLGDVDDNLLHANQIEVYKEGERETFQVLEDFNGEVQKNESVIIEDVNFDGYADIRLLKLLPSDANIPFFYWLYDPNTGKFVRNEDLEEVTSPEVDNDKKELRSNWRTNKKVSGTNYFQYQGEDLVLIRQESKEYVEEGKYKWKVKRLEGDELILVKDELIQEEIDEETKVKQKMGVVETELSGIIVEELEDSAEVVTSNK